ncbi:MAG TPA: glycosyltransferase, partial [Acidimicrobiales bacterium]|nr:glycosyltransferase [Acidimicrobiales bacterium]
GYSPTQWQRSRLPAEYQGKVRVIFDGIDPQVWRPLTPESRTVAGFELPPGRPIVSYVSRGFESMRGFDVFMKAARRLYQRRPDVFFVVVGSERIVYGGDERWTGGKSFKDWVLAQDQYDLSYFHFLGPIPPHELARLFCLTDLHIYLTVPFVLSWSLMNALACGAIVLASDTAPVQEMVKDGHNGLLVDFHDVEGFAETAARVLADPVSYRPLGQAAAEMVRQHYSLDVCLPQMLRLYQEAMSSGAPEQISCGPSS